MDTTRSRRDDEAEGTLYITSGPLGSVTCSTLPGSRAPFLIDYHHAVPQYEGDEAQPCDHFGTCYPEAGCGATELRREWHGAGRDDEVIWAELEHRYALLAAGQKTES